MTRTGGIKTIGWLTILNVLSAALAVVNTVAVAYYFGTGRAVEIYLAAVGLYASVISLAQTGQVSEVLLPAYHTVSAAHGRDKARYAYGALTNRFLGILAVVSIVGWLVAPQLMRLRIPGFATGDIVLATEMFRWILPLIVLAVAAELLKTLANAERMYGTPEVIALAARGTSLAALLMLAETIGVWAMIAALWIAAVVEVVLVLASLRREGYRHPFTLALPASAGNVALFGKLGATFPYVGLTQVFAFVLDAALSTLPQGSFAVFKYATTIWGRTQGIILRPLSVPFFTEFSDSSARGAPTQGRMTESALCQVLAVAAVVTTGVLCGAERALVGLWQGNQFPPDKITSLVWLLAGLYTMLPLAGTAMVLRKVAVSLHRIRETYLALAAVQAISAVLAWALIPRMGLVGGLAVMAFNLAGFCVAPIVALRDSSRSFQFRYPFDRLWKWATAAGVGAIVGLAIDHALSEAGLTAGHSRALDTVLGLAIAGTAMLVALGIARTLGVQEVAQLARFIADSVARRRARRR